MNVDTQKIERYLAERKLTKMEFAARCGIARANVSMILHRGICEPKTAGKLAAGLGVAVSEIAQ